MCAIALIVVHVLLVAVPWGLVVAYSVVGTTDALSVGMSIYRAVCQIVATRDGWTSSVGAPIFLIDAEDSNAAAHAARRVVDAHGENEVHVCVAVEADGSDYAQFAFVPKVQS